ncbi:MAG: 23S rRNA (pseudouridine(1915)-N(3))-methyltransferase RlmH [Chitinophagales bacterium]
MNKNAHRIELLSLVKMNITFLSTGKTSDKAIAENCRKYVSRLNNYCSFNWIETQDVKSLPPVVMKTKEGALLKKYLNKGDHIILLDEKGKEFTSPAFAKFLLQKQVENKKHVIFILGGAHGFSEEIQALANEKMSLSKMTFPHQLVRVIFLEQLYRAFTIIKNEPYHH